MPTFCKIIFQAPRKIQAEHNSVRMIPNPIHTSSTIVIQNVTGKSDYTFALYELLGNEVKRIEIRKAVSELKRDDLPSGIYFYNIISKEGEKIGNGKLVM